jgi:TPP-dependent pyruvate/acetoin dehydrogenase alpha subunit
VGIQGDVRLEIFRKALLARRFEERVAHLARAGEVPAALHLGAGHEVLQVAALAATRPSDPVLYGHRGTAYWIARGVPLERILCDIAYKEGGTNGGRGGVMHVIDTGRGILGESGTLGGNFVIGAGVAFAEQRLGTGSVTVVFFGDGTSNRGQFHEAANFAALKRLPLLLICENNGWGLSVPVSASTSVADIADRAAGYGMPGVVVDGREPDAVHAAVGAAAERARSGGGPTLVEAKVDRLEGHWLGDREPYRSADARALLHDRDPLVRLEADVIRRGLLDTGGRDDLEKELTATIDAAVEHMRAQPAVDPTNARTGVYA